MLAMVQSTSAAAILSTPQIFSRGGTALALGTSHRRSKAGAIAGGVIGGLVLLLILGAVLFWLLKEKKWKMPLREKQQSQATPQPILLSQQSGKLHENSSVSQLSSPYQQPQWVPSVPRVSLSQQHQLVQSNASPRPSQQQLRPEKSTKPIPTQPILMTGSTTSFGNHS